MSKRKSTMVELVAELEKLPIPRGQLVEQIIVEAKAGEYHDFKNRKYVCGTAACRVENPMVTRYY